MIEQRNELDLPLCDCTLPACGLSWVPGRGSEIDATLATYGHRRTVRCRLAEAIQDALVRAVRNGVIEIDGIDADGRVRYRRTEKPMESPSAVREPEPVRG